MRESIAALTSRGDDLGVVLEVERAAHGATSTVTITMVASIAHRATGLALAGGTLLLSWWLIAAATGPDAYAVFARVAANPVGEFILFGFLWSLAFHLLNGIRHLAWDIGYGFRVPTAKLTAALVFVDETKK